jgi:hypothetical protein
MSLSCTFLGLERSRSREMRLDVQSLIIAGWTGRDSDAVERHVKELEAIGVRRPSRTPIFYRVAADNLTQASRVQVAGRHSTGEVEFALIHAAGELWVGVGSDHTDRELEKHSVALSKQVCAKPLAKSLWKFEDVRAHWDELELRSHAVVRGERRLYQAGSVKSVLLPADLIASYCSATSMACSELPEGSVMFCGTLPVQGELEFAERFELELIDPQLGRVIRHEYDIDPLVLMDS